MPEKISILITALGGEGGGTLMNWILDCARSQNFFVQGTSVPGVAQRTGSTSYYIEICKKNFEIGEEPVLSMYPVAGMLDLVVSSELLETARVMERGFVSPERTVLLSSNSRTLTNIEKSDLYDGRFNSEKIINAGHQLAKKCIFLDLQYIAEKNSTVISAPMLGAIAASNVLPWKKDIFESVFDDDEFGKNSLEGFRSAFNKIINEEYNLDNLKLNKDVDNNIENINISLPDSLKKIIFAGMKRCDEYQNTKYADLYLNRITSLIENAKLSEKNYLSVMENTARRLCLWMVYEDIPRVAQLKISKNRFGKIKKEVNFKDGQILIVKDFFKPGEDELIAIMPYKLGRWFSKNKKILKFFPFLGKGVQINSRSIFGYFLMKFLSLFKKIRPISYRSAIESKEIVLWLEAMEHSLKKSIHFADILSDLPHLLKGYGLTWIRGKEKYKKIFDFIVKPAITNSTFEDDSKNLKQAISLAMNNEEIDKLNKFLLSIKKK